MLQKINVFVLLELNYMDIVMFGMKMKDYKKIIRKIMI